MLRCASDCALALAAEFFPSDFRFGAYMVTYPTQEICHQIPNLIVPKGRVSTGSACSTVNKEPQVHFDGNFFWVQP